MGKVRIIQKLCPERHCIVAAAYVEGEEISESVKAMLAQIEAGLGAHPWCGICGSAALRWEDSATRFDTMEEARPWLEKTQAANLAAMRLFSAQPKPN